MERIYPHPFFAREGWVFMGIAFAIALLVQIFAGGFLAFIFWLLFFFVAQFFRDPAREMTDDEKAVVAPVDGRVIKVEEAVCPYTGEQTKLVSIFMNVFNVHSQKTPVAGRIEKIEYFHGRYLNASLDKASDLNERNAVTVVTEDGQRVCSCRSQVSWPAESCATAWWATPFPRASATALSASARAWTCTCR